MNLPDKPSELLILAMTDLEACENDPNYRINMDHWCNYEDTNNGRVCEVCLAGAFLAKSTKYLPMQPNVTNVTASYRDHMLEANGKIPVKIKDKMSAIDEFRCGYLVNGLNWLDIPVPDSIPDSFNISYFTLSNMSRNKREEWKLHMCTIIGILKAEGL